MRKDLSELEKDIYAYDKESQDFIKSLKFVDKELSELNSMKRTGGWKLLESKIRSELHQTIFNLIKNDAKISTLIDLLSVADTKSRGKLLDDEIEKLIP